LKPGDLFGSADVPEARITHREKLAELERELEMRKNVYAKRVGAGTMSEGQAKRQFAVLQAVVADYRVRPWPQTLELVRTWRDRAEPLTVLGVRANQLHRDELLAVLAFSVDALKRAGLIDPKPEEPPP
jgi:hypothetical protein